MKIKSKIGQELQQLIEEKEILLELSNKNPGPTHIVVPEVLEKNFDRLKQYFLDSGVLPKIYLAHKCTKSKAFIQKAKEFSIGIDVASLGELQSALSVGFPSENIECTGPKNRAFVEKAVELGCLISVDSLLELQMILDEDKPATILLRISNPQLKDRNLQFKVSKFGISFAEISEAFSKMKNSKVQLKGFHVHNDERNPETKQAILNSMIDLMKQSYAEGFSPDIINIGGGFRTELIEDVGEWETFVSTLSKNILENKALQTWRNYPYGLYINDRGKISGREKIQGRFSVANAEKVIGQMFNSVEANGRSNAELLNENFWTIICEPGFYLLQQCGVTLLKVIGVKKNSEGDNLVLLDANMYNISSQMSEMLLDPLLLSPSNNETHFSGYLVGNLCREEDVLMKRKVFFDKTPQEGDVVCLVNTAPYVMDFEESNPHLHPMGVKYVAKMKGEKIHLEKEE